MTIENSINDNRLTVKIDVFGNQLTNFWMLFHPFYSCSRPKMISTIVIKRIVYNIVLYIRAL